jgi:tetraacyldisaccharide 4'-kinase
MGRRFDRQRWLSIISGRERSGAAVVLRALARLASVGYRVGVALRNAGYNRGLLRKHRAHVPVLSVGNLTTGGTGKTPMVMHLVARLQAMGRTPAILMRGYMPQTDQPSDEAALYRRRLPGVPVITNPDRIGGVRAIHNEHPSVDVIILDDGFQHRRLARDLNLVLIDASEPWGYGHLLPRGLLREPRQALRRADAVVLTHCESVDAEALDRLRGEVARRHGRPPFAEAAHRWARVIDAGDKTIASPPTDAGNDHQRVVAFCGLGNPSPFFREASRWFDLAEQHAFGDHEQYDATFVDWLSGRLRATGAAAGLTTEKDWVRLEPHLGDDPPTVWRAELEMTVDRGGAALDAALSGALGTST